MDIFNKQSRCNAEEEERKTHMFELLKVAAQEEFTFEFAQRIDFLVWADKATRKLVMRLKGRMLADKVLTDAADVAFEKTVYVDVEVEDRYWQWRVIPRSRKRWVRLPAKASGLVKVQADYFRAFPEADGKYYPADLGQSRRYMTVHQADQ